MDNNELIQFLEEYKKLLLEKDNSEDNYNIVLDAASRVKIKEENSNRILVYVGTYRNERYLNGNKEVITYDDDPRGEYKKYIDIETNTQYEIDIRNVKEFEKNNKVVYRDVVMNNMALHYKNYLDVRYEFFSSLISEPQKKLVLKLSKES